MKIIQRAEAKALGLKRYFTGNSCKYGHVADRATVNGLCLECSRIKQSLRYHADIEGSRRKQRIRIAKDPNNAAKKRARRYAKDPVLAEKVALRDRDKADRAAARSAGQPQYLSTRPCPKGHLGQRFAGDGHCVECNLISCRARFGWADRFGKAASKREAVREARAERKRLSDEARAERIERARPWHAARVTRQAAIRNGDKTYTGRPCPYGHEGLRYTGSGGCLACLAEYSASAEKKAYDFGYFRKNRDHIIKRTREYHRRNRGRNSKQAVEWGRRNPVKRRIIRKRWKAKNLHKVAADMSRRHASKLRATPGWADHKAIEQYYLISGFLTKELGISFEVDHVVPLRSSTVCGLHAQTNLSITLASWNRSKSNRWWPDMPKAA